MLKIILFLSLLGIGVSVPIEDYSNLEDTCGYKSCPKTQEGILNVHIVPHSHDDVGWLKTVDQYYYGSRNNIQKAGVQYILDSVVKELWEDPKRRFIYVETAFFWMWWIRQPDSIKRKVHTLVRQGRLQFVGGAWSMNDEAASHYQSTIDQFTWGLSKLNKTFGHCGLPRVGWQIDPFGHSREFASLLAGMGYDGLFLGRIDYQDKGYRLAQKRMEMVWRGDDDLGKSSDIFTGVLYNTYSPPAGFCFDVLCDDEPIIDAPDSPMYNVEEKVSLFMKYVLNQASQYRTKNVFITMGGDFTYQDAAMWYKNLDKLIQYTNLKAAKDGLDVKLFYSTPDCYLKAVKDANPTLPVKQDDFFPYASDSTAYWTGYFTSRPTTKYFEREGNNYLQMVKQLQVLSGLEEHNQFVLNELKSAMGVMQHHDAITGTEKQHVTHDYERILNQAIEDSLIIARQAFNKAVQGDALTPPLFTYDRCHFNESKCYTSENSEQFVITIYNPVAWYIKEPVRIPVVDGNYEVIAPNGEKIDSQLVELPEQVLKIPTRQSKATYEVVFIAYLNGLAVKNFYIRKVAKVKRDTESKRKNDYYDNINDYWRNIKDKTQVDIQNIEEEELNRKSDLIFEVTNRIPEQPVKVNKEEVREINLGVLKDTRGDKMREQIEELEKIIKEGKRRVGKTDRERTDNVYSNLNDEEMRMLSDDPMIVERFDDGVVYMENEYVKLKIDNGTGQITNIILPDGSQINYTIRFYYYPGCVGDNRSPVNRSSGAYIFRPNATKPIEVGSTKTEQINGIVVKENRVALNNNVLSVVKIYDGVDFIEHEWLVGPIDVNDDIGKEFIVKYETDIVNNGEFYTDSNGRQVLKRKLNERPEWNVTLEEPIAGNYYPVTNEIYIENSSVRFSVLTDRSQGGTSLVEGDVELMLHRRLLHDDAFGVGEALNETANGHGLVVRGKHRILLSSSDDKDEKERKQILRMHLQPLVFVSDAKDVDLEKWLSLKNQYSWVKDGLPEGIHLLTLEPWDSKLLIRLENYLKKSANSTVEVDLQSVLKNINMKSAKETTLAANQWLENYQKWNWEKQGNFVKRFNENFGSFNDAAKAVDEDNDEVDDGFKIKIKAKQIRTFVIDYDYVI